MDGTTLQTLIYEKGYGKAAAKIGQPYNVFRPTGASNPVSGTPLITGLLVSPNQKGDYKAPNKFGDAIWWSYHDGTQTLPGDYLVGDQGTFFIVSQQDLLPIQLERCNRVLSITRVTQNTGKGVVAYGGGAVEPDTDVLIGWPASVLEGAKGENNATGLPLDVKNPWWKVAMPAYGGIQIMLGDRVSDDLGNRYWVNSAEESALGWRLKLMQVQS